MHPLYTHWKHLPYRNQSINLQSKSMDWFLYDKFFQGVEKRCNGNEWVNMNHAISKPSHETFTNEFFIKKLQPVLILSAPAH